MKSIAIIVPLFFAACVLPQEVYSSENLEDISATRNSVIGRPQMTVEGEIRTVNETSKPQLWGKGRYGVVRYGVAGTELGLCLNTSQTVAFGLSNVVTQWDSVANGCPAGTWVCSSSDFEDPYFDCDTNRPSTGFPALNCDGTEYNLSPTSHYGWVADLNLAGDHPYWAFSESPGSLSTQTACRMLPVWCCSEYLP